MVGEDRVVQADLVVHAQGGGGELDVPVRAVEPDLDLLVRRADPAEPVDEVHVPGRAAELPVGGRPEPGLALHPDHVADGGVLRRGERGRVDAALGAAVPGREQLGRTQQAADMVGAERRGRPHGTGCTFGHGSLPPRGGVCGPANLGTLATTINGLPKMGRGLVLGAASGPVPSRRYRKGRPVRIIDGWIIAMQMVERPWGVTAYGAASVKAAPDLVRARFKVIRVEQTPSDAFAVASDAVQAVRRTLRGHGVADGAVERSRLGLKSSWSYGSERKFLGYECQAAFSVESADLDDVQGLLVDLVAAAPTRSGRRVRRDRQGRPARRARREAVTAARRKAELYAEAAGVRIGAVIHIDDVDPEGSASSGTGATAPAVPRPRRISLQDMWWSPPPSSSGSRSRGTDTRGQPPRCPGRRPWRGRATRSRGAGSRRDRR